MKKRTVALMACAVFAAGIVSGAMASDMIKEIKAQLRPDFTIKIDGEKKTFKNVNGDIVYPILYDGTTYLPLRAIGEIIGKTVYWYEDDKRIELKEEKNSTVTDADVIIIEENEPKPKNPPEITLPVEPKPTPQILSKEDFIGTEKAQQIALKKAGITTADVIFKKTELDKDDGVWHYEIEFKQGHTEYEADIKADDGSIIKWEVDIDD